MLRSQSSQSTRCGNTQHNVTNRASISSAVMEPKLYAVNSMSFADWYCHPSHARNTGKDSHVRKPVPTRKQRATQIHCSGSTRHKSSWVVLFSVAPVRDLHSTQPDLLHCTLFVYLLALPKLDGKFCTRCKYVSGQHQVIVAQSRLMQNAAHTPPQRHHINSTQNISNNHLKSSSSAGTYSTYMRTCVIITPSTCSVIPARHRCMTSSLQI